MRGYLEISSNKIRILFFEEEKIFCSLYVDGEIGEEIVVPGLSVGILKTDSTFSCFCTNTNGDKAILFLGSTVS